jgi:hypothetical protein
MKSPKHKKALHHYFAEEFGEKEKGMDSKIHPL